MASTTFKKVDIQVSSAVYKSAKLKAVQEGKTVSEWIAALVQSAIHQEQPTISALDWGRIDSRIDERTARLELQLETLTKQVEQLSIELRLQKESSDRPATMTSPDAELAYSTFTNY